MIQVSDRSILSRWERGLAVPGIVQVFRLARIYRVLPHELYEGLWKQIDREIELRDSNKELLMSNQSSDDV
jgi:hypothetical protein